MTIRWLIALATIAVGVQTPHEKPLDWTPKRAKLQRDLREDFANREQEVWEADLSAINDRHDGPMRYGTFPTPRYDGMGAHSFHGCGFRRIGPMQVGDKQVYGVSYMVKNNPYYQRMMGVSRPNMVYFHIIVLVGPNDSNIDPRRPQSIFSRNHPRIIGEGSIQTQTDPVEFMAFQSPKDAYAIVNMRIFDLTVGRTILIAPQRDKTLRSMQIESPLMTEEEIEAYQERALKSPKVKAFFTAQGNI